MYIYSIYESVGRTLIKPAFITYKAQLLHYVKMKIHTPFVAEVWVSGGRGHQVLHYKIPSVKKKYIYI